MLKVVLFLVCPKIRKEEAIWYNSVSEGSCFLLLLRGWWRCGVAVNHYSCRVSVVVLLHPITSSAGAGGSCTGGCSCARRGLKYTVTINDAVSTWWWWDVVWPVVTHGGGVVGIIVVAHVCWAIVTYGEKDGKSSSGIAGMANGAVSFINQLKEHNGLDADNNILSCWHLLTWWR